MQKLRITIAQMFLWWVTILFLFFAFLYSDNTMVGFSEFSFLSGNIPTNTITFTISWGQTTWFSLMITNKESINMTYKLWFVDWYTTTDWLNHQTCLSENQNQTVGQYISWDTSTFLLAAGNTWAKTISIHFPNNYSWLYYGCVMLQPTTTYGSTDITTLPRRGIFLEATVYPTTIPVVIKAFPSNRVYQETNNINQWTIKVYDINKHFVTESSLIELNAAWTWQGNIYIPPGNYYIVFKGQSHLASYLSGVTLNQNDELNFDFTTWSSLYNTQQVNDVEDDGYRYQTAGDLKNIAGNYDFTINGNDIAILTVNGFQESSIPVLDPRNLNGDIAINASDISVIWVNFAKTDPYFESSFFTW